jgi:hypothetical protein
MEIWPVAMTDMLNALLEFYAYEKTPSSWTSFTLVSASCLRNDLYIDK